jgi:hypothetical protein
MKRSTIATIAAVYALAAAYGVAAGLAQSPPAAPATFPVAVTGQDTANIRQICDFARTSSAVNLETAGALAQYCLTLISRIANAEADHKKAAEAAKPPEEPKK